jgi:hypothetical protein
MMFNALYPAFAIDKLLHQRSQRWADLVAWLRTLPVTDPHVMAFTLTMRRLHRYGRLDGTIGGDCLCAVCAAQVVGNFRGSEEELLDFYYKNLDEVNATIKEMRARRAVTRPLAGVA